MSRDYVQLAAISLAVENAIKDKPNNKILLNMQWLIYELTIAWSELERLGK